MPDDIQDIVLTCKLLLIYAISVENICIPRLLITSCEFSCYSCNICGRGFPRSASLRYHIKTHDKGGGVPVACDVCNRSFSTENRMQKHKRFKHPAQAPVFRCDQCGKVFTAKSKLNTVSVRII